MDITAVHRQTPSKHALFGGQDESRRARPSSVATVFVDTVWDDDLMSEADDNSPRVSLQSRSITTASSYDEVPTPTSSTGPLDDFIVGKQTQGPRGPHLFRSTIDASPSAQDEIWALQPLASGPNAWLKCAKKHVDKSAQVVFRFCRERLDSAMLVSWSPAMVAQSMLDSGLDVAVAHRFIENDISGEILMTLKFEDLRELNIASFGIRTRVWHHIQTLRDNNEPASPLPSTPIENVPSQEARSETGWAQQQGAAYGEERYSGRYFERQGERQGEGKRMSAPLDPVSIIGIEQLVPKPHHCSKGAKCSKWKRQQRVIEEFQRANPHVDMGATGPVLTFAHGSTGELEDDAAMACIQHQPHGPILHHPSAVAANPHHGLRQLQRLHIPARAASPQRKFTPPSTLPPLAEQEAEAERGSPYNMAKVDAPWSHAEVQRRVVGSPFSELDVPLTAVMEGPVARQASQSVPPTMVHRSLHIRSQSGPLLYAPLLLHGPVLPSPALSSTPGGQETSLGRQTPFRQEAPFRRQETPFRRQETPFRRQETPFRQQETPFRRQETPFRRQETPFRQQETPVRQQETPVRQQETPVRQQETPVRQQETPVRQQEADLAASLLSRLKSSWSPTGRSKTPESSPPKPLKPDDYTQSSPSAPASNIAYQGPMKKRRLRLFGYEWQDGYFTLTGTHLSMHKDANDLHSTLQVVDIDDYAITCSSVGSKSKLSAALKAMHISQPRGKNEGKGEGKSHPVAAFSFQLVPHAKDAGLRLRRSDNSRTASADGPSRGISYLGKTHHFAVQSRDEGISWMRELLLAKAVRQKRDGFQVRVNGNMI